LKPRRSTVRVFCEHCSPIAESACNLKPQDFRQVGRNPFRVGDSDLANDKLQNLIERAVILSNNGVLPNPLPTSDKNPLTVTPSQGTFNDSTRALILVRGIAGGRLGYRRIRWRCRPAGTEADHFNCQDEEARNLPAGTPERYDSTPGYACRVSNGRDQHLSVISTLIAVSPSALKHAQEIATSFSEL
jgi:hypothetical protein